MTISKQSIINAYPQYKDNYFYEFNFGSNADLLGNLVLEHKKLATTSLQYLYELENERQPQVGDIGIVLNSQGKPMCAIYNHKVELRMFSNIDEHVAILKGEGDLSLAYWQNTHKHFFNQILATYNRTLKDTDIVIVEYFEMLNL